MSKWTLSLTDLANQAEAFLEQVDKKAADSLQDNSDNEKIEDSNFFSSLSSSIIETNSEPLAENRSEASYSSPEVLPSAQDIESINGSENSQDSKTDDVEERRLELENKLIKQEMSLLTDEIGMLSNKLYSYQERSESAEKETRVQAEKLKRAELESNRLRDKKSDLEDALTAKDTQIGVLKVRLAEADAELLAQTAQSKNLKEELKVASSCYSELTELKENVVACNENIRAYKDKLDTVQSESREKESELQVQITALTTTLHQTEQTLDAEKRKYKSAVSETKLTKNELESARKDLADYRERATRVLQAKEKRSSSDTAILDDEGVEVLMQEHNLLQSQLRSARRDVDSLKEHVSSMGQLHSEELQEALDKCSVSESVIRENECAISEYQTTLSQLKEEMFVTQRELASIRSSSAAELRTLREQLSVERSVNTGPGTPSEGELEAKIKSLTEVLLTKQTEVERLSSERSSLVMRLESLETVLLTVERKNNSVSIPVEKEGFVEQRTSYKSERLRGALNSIDKFSIRLGVFLRRYPQARLMVIGYMLLLHSWVMVVLLTYTPEIHNH